MKRVLPAAISVVLVAQTCLLAAAGWHSRYDTGPDGVAYVLLASHWAGGRLELGATGYWGPLLSWIIAPLFGLVSEPLYAARIAMGVSAIVFALGALAVLTSLALPRGAVLAGTGAAALASVPFSVDGVTPDLLVAGLVALGAGALLAPSWADGRRRQVAAGALFGLAYLAKAVALPIFVLMAILIAGARGAVRPLAVTAAAFAVVSGPWVLVLSGKYGALTFSTSARIAHTIAGPRDVDRNHPFGLMIAEPEAGRLTWWEDPTAMPYRHWSPFESEEYFDHQARVIGVNARFLAQALASFDALHVGVVCAAVALVLFGPWRRGVSERPWRWAAPAALATCVVYLPVYALSPRYQLPAYPLLFAAAAGLVMEVTMRKAAAIRAARAVLLTIVAFSFAAPALAPLPELLRRGGPEPASRALARRLDAAHLRGPVAGDTMEGLLLAFFLGEPFHGGFPSATAGDYATSGAELVVAVRAFPIARELDQSPLLENLDGALFTSPRAAETFPLKVWRVRARSA